MTNPPAAPETIGAPAGWYSDHDDAGLERYWNGASWSNDWRPRAGGPESAAATANVQPAPATADRRRAMLGAAVSSYVRMGGEVEYQDDWRAIVAFQHKPNHVLHGVLSLLTLGLWLPVWALVAIGNKRNRYELIVDEYGQVRWPDGTIFYAGQ